MRLATLVVCFLPIVALAATPPAITQEESERMLQEWNESFSESVGMYRAAIDDMCRDGKLGDAYYGLDADDRAGILELGELVELFKKANPNGTRADACQRALQHQLVNMLTRGD